METTERVTKLARAVDTFANLRTVNSMTDDPSSTAERNVTLGSLFLLALVCVMVFGIPFFPMSMHTMLYNVFFTVIFFTAVVALAGRRKPALVFAIVVTVVEWVTTLAGGDILPALSRVCIMLFFVLIVAKFISQIARTKQVTAGVILASINGYLLIGLVFSLLVAVIMIIDPGAYSFPGRDSAFQNPASSFSDYTYYTFVTLTTVGYGDIVPQVPYAKSLATLIGISGQMYVAILIAMLVGKYSSGT